MSFQTIFPITLSFLQQIIKQSTVAFSFQFLTQVEAIILKGKSEFFPLLPNIFSCPQLYRQVIKEITLLLWNLVLLSVSVCWESIANAMKGPGASKRREDSL